MSKWNKSGTQLLPKVRKAIYDKAIADYLSAFEAQPNGELVVPLGEIEGKPVNLIVNATVSGRTVFEKKTATKAKAEVEEEVVDVDSLFD